MNVTLPAELADYVQQKVARGEYGSPDEVIQDALRLLHEEEEKTRRLGELRRSIAVGVEQADQGQVGPLSAAQTLKRIRERRSPKGEEAG